MNETENNLQLYCNSLTSYSRFKTREVKIGNIAIGGDNPIRVQSMTTTDTMDTKATIAQSIRMIEAGCEIVRITAPSITEAENLKLIKAGLVAAGFNTPIVADIHFTPNAAEVAARYVEKVRINPGNFVDKKKFEQLIYTDATYEEELERIRKRFIPLVEICKLNGTAMRIGTNHGSLSDRIMSRYGDTPLGMVESALEFLRIARELNYHQLVLSMKSSNTQVMVEAYRLLVNKMILEKMNYPLHLGVTEAGEGEDGRIKSAVGIGSLLEDGLGDTVRVSLTEDPEFEIPVAKALIAPYQSRGQSQKLIPIISQKEIANHYDPFEYKKRKTIEVNNIGSKNVPSVVADLSTRKEITTASFFPFGYNYNAVSDKWNISDQACDYIYLGDNNTDFEIPGTLGLIINSQTWLNSVQKERCYPLFCASEFFEHPTVNSSLNFVVVNLATLTSSFVHKIKSHTNVVLVAETNNSNALSEQRRIFFELLFHQCTLPLIIKRNFKDLSETSFQLQSSAEIGGLFIDGFGDGIWLNTLNCGNLQNVNSTSFGILQATRTRTSKTEYISCPSCGRTLFDLQETTRKIRVVTDHLKGLKIGVMGCIVNGPGEMADADYGYVGTGIGKITLYKGKEVVKRNIASEKAVDALIDLIKEHGDWEERV